jgi:hypothetical protein
MSMERNHIIDFAVWYSGMDRKKVERAFKRYIEECSIPHVSNCKVCGSDKIHIDKLYTCDDCNTFYDKNGNHI